MEASGRRPRKDDSNASAQHVNTYCQPCHKKGKQLSAHGYCQTCAEYLCDTCNNIHTIPTPSTHHPHTYYPTPCQHHVLLDKSNMPKSLVKPRVQASKCTVVCPTHPDKFIEFFCPVHDAVVCGVCAVLRHKPCKVNYIPDIAQNYKTSPDYTNLQDTMDHIEQDIDECLKFAAVNSKVCKESSDKAIDKIRQFRTEMNAYLDKKEHEILLTVKKMQTEDGEAFKKVQTDCQAMKSDITKMKTNLKKLENDNSDLFITTKQVEGLIRDLQVQLDNCSSKTQASSYSFEREQTIDNILSSQSPFGKLNKIDNQRKTMSYEQKNVPKKSLNFAKAKISRLKDVSVKSSKETHSCAILGATLLSPSRMLVTDWHNMTVKSIDITHNTVTSCLDLSSHPSDITSLPSHRAAITLPTKQQIQLISTSGDLSPISTISVNGQCEGIDSTDDILLVSYFHPAKVEVMDHHGGVLQSFINDINGKSLFNLSHYVAVSWEEGQELVYISDSNTNTITKLSLDGSVLLTYTDYDFSIPYGLTATGDGQVIVCSLGGNNVQLVCGKTGKKTRTLLTETDGIVSPLTVCYCPVEHKLYISCRESNSLNVYQLE